MNKITKAILIAGGIGVAASVAGRALLRQSRRFDWVGKTVLVTGGSRGLGLCLARKLVDAGANVVTCARTSSDLETAELELRQRAANVWPDAATRPRVLAIACDVRECDSVESMMAEVVDQFGGIDVLINNAGVIEVGPFDAMTEKDFQRSMDTHCWGTLNMVRSVLPGMRSRGWGRILNVASIGGKRAVPHMLPYAASKFALVGLSTGLRAELAHENILVTTVCPGLMRTGSPRNAIFKGQHRKEYAWFSIGDSLPMMSINAMTAAEKILQACNNGDAEVVIAGSMNFTSLAARLAPNWTAEMLSLMDQMLPEMGGIGRRAAKGHESESAWSPSILTRLTNLAAVRNNEI